MRRAGGLFQGIVAPDNLRLAFVKAAKGKRGKVDVRRFSADLGEEIVELRRQLLEGMLTVGEFRRFRVYDPKERTICAAAFRERVVHHAIVNVCEPEFERWLIDDTYACRPGKGREAAVARALGFHGRGGFFWKADVAKFFDSVPHEVLKETLTRRFREGRLLELFGRIIESYEVTVGRGLPIGNLMSQHFANFYLGFLDRYVKEGLRVRRYVRYMDDFVIWGRARSEVEDSAGGVGTFLENELGLRLKGGVSIGAATGGVDFLGVRVLAHETRPTRESVRRARRRVVGLSREFREGRCSELEYQRRLEAVFAWVRSGGSLVVSRALAREAEPTA